MNKCCDKIKGRLLTLALIVSMLLGQTVPVAVSAEDTSTETVNPILLERARSRMQKDALRNYKMMIQPSILLMVWRFIAQLEESGSKQQNIGQSNIRILRRIWMSI